MLAYKDNLDVKNLRFFTYQYLYDNSDHLFNSINIVST